MTSVAPFLIFLLGATLAAATKGRLRSVVLLVLIAKEMRKILMRKDDYYDD